MVVTSTRSFCMRLCLMKKKIKESGGSMGCLLISFRQGHDDEVFGSTFLHVFSQQTYCYMRLQQWTRPLKYQTKLPFSLESNWTGLKINKEAPVVALVTCRDPSHSFLPLSDQQTPRTCDLRISSSFSKRETKPNTMRSSTTTYK